VLAGRGFRHADASIGQSLRAFSGVRRPHFLDRFRFKSGSTKSMEDVTR